MFELEQNREGFDAAVSHGQAGACSQWGFWVAEDYCLGVKTSDLGTRFVHIPKWYPCSP